MKKGWVANLRLRYQRDGARTVLREKQHEGPLVVQKALYPEDEQVCHSVIVHPPGGIVGGDQLSINAVVEEGAHVLLTTPGATRWYRSLGPCATQRVSIAAEQGAVVEWLPQETIYFNEAIAQNAIDVSLASNATFIGWEVACLGRVDAGEQFIAGRVRQAMNITVDRKLVFAERGTIAGIDASRDSAVGLVCASVYGTFVAHSPKNHESLLQACREAVAGESQAGLSLIGNTLVGRTLGHSSEAARQLFMQWWSIVREPLVGQAAIPPRIWRT